MDVEAGDAETRREVKKNRPRVNLILYVISMYVIYMFCLYMIYQWSLYMYYQWSYWFTSEDLEQEEMIIYGDWM